MKNRTAIFGFTALVAFIGFKMSVDPAYQEATQTIEHQIPLKLQSAGFFTNIDFTSNTSKTKIAKAKKLTPASDIDPDSLLKIAEQYLGTHYVYGGNTPDGFDCSGFTNYVYGQCGFDVPHGSANQAMSGYEIPLTEAQKGDLLIFTGTNLSVREPGHVGIVISQKGEPVKFIHSSSNGGVKISEVPTTRYAARLLQVRRIL